MLLLLVVVGLMFDTSRPAARRVADGGHVVGRRVHRRLGLISVHRSLTRHPRLGLRRKRKLGDLEDAQHTIVMATLLSAWVIVATRRRSESIRIDSIPTPADRVRFAPTTAVVAAAAVVEVVVASKQTVDAGVAARAASERQRCRRRNLARNAH